MLKNHVISTLEKMEVVTLRHWIWALLAYAFIACIILWVCLGSISLSLQGKGLIAIDKTPVIYGYFPIESGKFLKVGDPIEMTIPSVNTHIYGSIKGTIDN